MKSNKEAFREYCHEFYGLMSEQADELFKSHSIKDIKRLTRRVRTHADEAVKKRAERTIEEIDRENLEILSRW